MGESREMRAFVESVGAGHMPSIDFRAGLVAASMSFSAIVIFFLASLAYQAARFLFFPGACQMMYNI